MEEMTTQTLSGPEMTGSHPTHDISASNLPFLDTGDHALDAKYRLTLPAGARAAFMDGGVLLPWTGPCIAVFTEAGFARWMAHAKRVLPDAGYDNPAAHIRFAYSQGSRFKPDVQGRFQLAERLRLGAGIERDVTIVGVGSRLELWHPQLHSTDVMELSQNLAHHQDEFDLLGDDE